MTIVQDNQVNPTEPSQNVSDKELNFRALQAKYERQLQQVQEEKERLARELEQREIHSDDDDSDPYVDQKKLDKKLAKFGENTMKQTQSEIQRAVNEALHNERKEKWLEQNPDFHEIMQTQTLQKFMEAKPDLVKTILNMPDNFERQQLVYNTIKALSLDKPAPKESSIQDKINANRQSPYYHPSSVGTAPYAMQGDFSPAGQKQAYEKMKELKARLRI